MARGQTRQTNTRQTNSRKGVNWGSLALIIIVIGLLLACVNYNGKPISEYIFRPTSGIHFGG